MGEVVRKQNKLERQITKMIDVIKRDLKILGLLDASIIIAELLLQRCRECIVKVKAEDGYSPYLEESLSVALIVQQLQEKDLNSVIRYEAEVKKYFKLCRDIHNRILTTMASLDNSGDLMVASKNMRDHGLVLSKAIDDIFFSVCVSYRAESILSEIDAVVSNNSNDRDVQIFNSEVFNLRKLRGMCNDYCSFEYDNSVAVLVLLI